MVRLVYGCLVLALAACPKKGTTAQPQTGAGCPAASGVYVASYVTQDKGRNGWAVALHSTPASADAPAYANLDANAASAAGMPPAPTGTIWLVTQEGRCRAKLGAYYAEKFEGAQVLSYGFELDGCPTPKNPDDAGGIVLVSDQEPAGCRIEGPQPIAARLGEMGKDKKWQRPTKETQLPKPLLAAIPQKTCAAPACETLWAFAEVKIDNKPVAWTGAVNWLQIGNEPDQCAWQAERVSGFWIPAQGGAAAVRVTEGQEQHPLPLLAVLADGGGAKIALAEAAGEYATYDLSPGRAALGHHIVWVIAPPEAWEAVDHLGPICDEDRD